MSQPTANEQLRTFLARRAEISDRIVEYTKLLEPALRDAGLHHQADRLQALLGEIDRVETELKAALDQNPREMLAALIEGLGRSNR